MIHGLLNYCLALRYITQLFILRHLEAVMMCIFFLIVTVIYLAAFRKPKRELVYGVGGSGYVLKFCDMPIQLDKIIEFNKFQHEQQDIFLNVMKLNNQHWVTVSKYMKDNREIMSSTAHCLEQINQAMETLIRIETSKKES